MITEILKLSLPIMLANIIMMTAIIINTKIIATLPDYNLYIFSLFLPINFWVVALYESLRVPIIAISSYAHHNNNLKLIGSQLTFILLLTCIGATFPIIIIKLCPNIISKLFIIHNKNTLLEFQNFTSSMLGASFILSMFYLLSAIFNGINCQKIGLLLVSSGVVLSTLLNFILVKYSSLGLLSMPFATCSSYFILLIITIYILIKYQIITSHVIHNIFHFNNLKRLQQLSLPVWLSYIIITLTLFCFNYLLLPFGEQVVSGFGIAFRIQTIILLPAIATGTAIGILINKREKAHLNINRKIILNGIMLCLSFYILLTLVLNNYALDFIHLITQNKIISCSANDYFKIVGFSYIGLSISLCISIVLDQIGYGILSVVFSLCIFIIEIISAYLLFKFIKTPQILYWVIAIGNNLSGFLGLLFVFLTPQFQFASKFSIE